MPLGHDPNSAVPRRDDVRLVRCGTCGRSDECSPADMLGYTRRGWPKCCGEVMTLYTRVEKPTPDGTPPLPPNPLG